MKQAAALVFCIFLSSCFLFENPVDPSSSNYVGFPVEKGVTLAEFSQSDYGELFYPTLAWTSISGSVYYLHLSTNEDFSFSSNDYQGIFSHYQLMKNATFTTTQGWFTIYDSQYLDRLGVGRYYIRVSVSNSVTGNRFCTWSRPAVFTQKLKQIKAGWENDQQFYAYSYTNDGLYKKADSYYLFTSLEDGSSEARHVETVVYAYRKDGTTQFEFVYNDPKALSSQYKFHYYYDIKQYENSENGVEKRMRVDCFEGKTLSAPIVTDRNALKNSEIRYIQNGKIKNIEYFSPIPGESPADTALDDEEFLNRYFYISKERIYNYDSAGTAASIRENRYRYVPNQPPKNKINNYFIFKVKNSSIYRGEYYASADATDVFYAYDISYYDEENRYPQKATYTYNDGRESDPYIYSYNFTTIEAIESENEDIVIGFSKKETVGARRNSSLPEIPASGFVF